MILAASSGDAINLHFIVEILGACASVAICLGLLYDHYRPARRAKERLFDALLGNDGSDGLPILPSIFSQLDELKQGQAAAGKHMNDQDEKLNHLVDELPKNGIPARSAVDAIASGFLVLEENMSTLTKDFKNERRAAARRQAIWQAALAAQNIKVPPPETKEEDI